MSTRRTHGQLTTSVTIRQPGVVLGPITPGTLATLGTASDAKAKGGVGPDRLHAASRVFPHDDGSSLESIFAITGDDNATLNVRLWGLLPIVASPPRVAGDDRVYQWVRQPIVQATITAGTKVGVATSNDLPSVLTASARYVDTIAVTWDRTVGPLTARTSGPIDANGSALTPDNEPVALVVDPRGFPLLEWEVGTGSGTATACQIIMRWY